MHLAGLTMPRALSSPARPKRENCGRRADSSTPNPLTRRALEGHDAWTPGPNVPAVITMSADFETIHNHHERAVFEAVLAARAQYPNVPAGVLADVACVALNRLPPRYIRHEVDYAFYLTEQEREANTVDLAKAVSYAYEFVQARHVVKARL